MKASRPTRPSETTIKLRIVLVAPPKGVDFGVQEGKGNDYRTIQKQQSNGGNLQFECSIVVKNNREDGLPNFLGPLTVGHCGGRRSEVNHASSESTASGSRIGLICEIHLGRFPLAPRIEPQRAQRAQRGKRASQHASTLFVSSVVQQRVGFVSSHEFRGTSILPLT
jgi:hypothetical protein